MIRVRPRARTLLAVVAAALAVSACGTLHAPRWPWNKPAPEAPEPASAMVMTAADGSPAAWPQSWKRNALLVDLQSAGPSGSFEMRPREGKGWPVRVAFRLRPGTFGQLEVRGDQRAILPVATDGAQPVDLELAPGVYGPRTRALVVSWGATQSPPGAR